MTRDTYTSYTRLLAYADDLKERVVANRAWKDRHPDWLTFDHETWERVTDADPYPSVEDVVTAERLLDILAVALAAYERGGTL